ncbi:hypothetical protein G9A89_018963 [Geosiphon pyriformis]|nr:hypothetical protein G9A89_018963 [Geosiphon pyriformis]
MPDKKTYRILFKDDTPNSVIEKYVNDIKAQGGEAYKNKLYKGIIATVPLTLFNSFSDSAGPHIDTVEEEGTVTTQN